MTWIKRVKTPQKCKVVTIDGPETVQVNVVNEHVQNIFLQCILKVED